MNNAIVEFVRDFENMFSNCLIDPKIFPKYQHKKSFPNSKYFKFKYDKKPNHPLSDWDLECWLDDKKLKREDMQDIDFFIRNFRLFSDVGLFSKPTGGNQHLQYMTYTPNQSYAPFLDLHLRCGVNSDIYSMAYRGFDDEHKKWSVLTAWRKKKKGDIDTKFGARKTYKDHIEQYWPNEEEKFIKDPQIFFSEKFPNLDPPSALLD